MKYNNLINNINTFYKIAQDIGAEKEGIFTSDKFDEWQSKLRQMGAGAIKQVWCNHFVFPGKKGRFIPICQATSTTKLLKPVLLLEFIVPKEHEEKEEKEIIDSCNKDYIDILTSSGREKYVKELLAYVAGPEFKESEYIIKSGPEVDNIQGIDNPYYKVKVGVFKK